MNRLPMRVSSAVRPVLVTLGWGTCLSGVTLWAIFQGLLLPRELGGLLLSVREADLVSLVLYYLAIFGVSVLSAAIIRDPGKALGSFLAAYVLGTVITYLVLVSPALIGLEDFNILANSSVNFTFRAFFPFVLILTLVATIVGIALDEYLA